MKKFIFNFLLIAILFSCSNQPKIETYTVTVEVPESDGKEFVLYKINKELISEPVDTVQVKDSIFTFVVPKQNPELAMIKAIDDPAKRLALIIGEADVSIKVKDKYGFSADVTGSSSILTKKLFEYYQNEIKNREKAKEISLAFQVEQDPKKQDSIKQVFNNLVKQIKKEQYDFIENNKNIVGLVAMQSALNSPEAEFGVLRKIFMTYPPAVQKTGIGKYINVTLLTKGVTDIGGKAPNFIAPTPDGKRLSLNAAMGKVTLIDFWASWCKPCRVENPYVVSLYKKYHDRGFNIIGVSLDKSKEAWIKAIKKDSMEWLHVSNLKFWQEPIAKLYGVSAIPQTFLLNSQGIIVAKNLRGKELEDKIVELLNN